MKGSVSSLFLMRIHVMRTCDQNGASARTQLREQNSMFDCTQSCMRSLSTCAHCSLRMLCVHVIAELVKLC